MQSTIGQTASRLRTGRVRAGRGLLRTVLVDGRRWRPRRVAGLPPGQRLLSHPPRFGLDPGRPPPAVPDRTRLVITAPGRDDLVLSDLSDLVGGEAGVHRGDLHCVTTWSVRDLAWSGVGLARLWSLQVSPWLGTRVPRYATASGADGFRAIFLVADLLADSTVLAWGLGGRALTRAHGAPLRLVCPPQYGYKSVKHLVRIDLTEDRPRSGMGALEHLRARVAAEERHARLPGRLLRIPYRLLIGPTAVIAERASA